MTKFGPSLDQLWTKFELTLDRFGVSLVSVWDLFGVGLGPVWNWFWSVLKWSVIGFGTCLVSILVGLGLV